MKTEFKEFILIPLRMEITETGAPGTSPEAPGGPAFEEKEKQDYQSSVEDPEEIEHAPHDRPHIGAFEFPEKEDSRI